MTTPFYTDQLARERERAALADALLRRRRSLARQARREARDDRRRVVPVTRPAHPVKHPISTLHYWVTAGQL